MSNQISTHMCCLVWWILLVQAVFAAPNPASGILLTNTNIRLNMLKKVAIRAHRPEIVSNWPQARLHLA